MQLTQEQLIFFQENGFLLLRDFASKEECRTILDIAKRHLEHNIAPIETESEYNHSSDKKLVNTTRRLKQVYSRDAAFKAWMENRAIRSILKQVLGESPVIVTAHHNSIMTKMPHNSTQSAWHQDKRYWHYDGDNLVSIWLALGEENSQNGVLEFIPKSHMMHFTKEQFDELMFFREDLEENRKLIETKVSFDLKAGDVVLFHALLLHRANKNNTKSPKISFVYTAKGTLTKAIKGTRSDSQEIVLDNI